MFNFLTSHGFEQVIKEYTTIGGTLLDAVYVCGNLSVCAGILEAWYSYHRPVYIVANEPRI